MDYSMTAPADQGRRTACIYALACPTTGEVRYIGKANDPHARLLGHLRDSKRRDTPVYRWIRKLIANGLQPRMTVLVESENWRADEIRLIAQHRESGRLLNVADGGDEPACPTSVRAANGRKNAAAVHGDPIRRKLWEYKKAIGETLRWMRKHGHTDRAERIAAKMRAMAAKHSHTCGEWAAA